MSNHIVARNYEDLSAQAADRIARIVTEKPGAVLCFASGHTPIGTYRVLVEMARQGHVDFSLCHFIGLDEWVGIPSYSEGSCRYLLDTHFFKKIKVHEGQTHFFDGMAADLQAECRKMDETIARLGGLDLMLVGIGMNGHIALNEPGTPWHLRSHVAELDEMTCTVGQKYFNQETPLTKGITLGLQYLREARLPMLLSAGADKAPILRLALEGDVTEQVPASIFQVLEKGVVISC